MSVQTAAGTRDALQGLGCPNCGGMVPIPEGQSLVICPYCEQRAIVRGERGLRRYQVPLKISEEAACSQLGKFLSSSSAIAGKVRSSAKLAESFLVFLPYWLVRARVMGWVFGQEKVRRGDNTHYESREIKIVEEMAWTSAAADVGEFGVNRLLLEDKPLEPYNYDYLHDAGMVFEPVSSQSEAGQQAAQDFRNRVRSLGSLDRVSQEVVRQVNNRTELVYYPLWVVRYSYRGRTFQLVIDGHNGEILFGKAPGSTMYRAAMLVGGAAVGAVLLVDVPVIALGMGIAMEDDDGFAFFGALALASLGAGFLMIQQGFKRFRYGEHYEFRAYENVQRRVKRSREGGVLRAREELKK